MESLPILFVLSSLIIIITPGQDMVLVMSRSISAGSGAGVATAAGVSVGLMGHTLLATFGLGAILSSSPILFSTIKFIGAAYLVYLGIRMIRSSSCQLGYAQTKQTSYWRMFVQGMASNIANPKITLFYFAYLPQFLAHQSDNHAMSLFLLGTFFALLTFAIKAPIGYGAGRLSVYLRTNPRILKIFNKLSGTVLIGLGLRLALSSRE